MKLKSIQSGKEEVKLSLYTDDMIPYIENPKEYTHIHTQNLEELIKELSKGAG